MDYVKAELVQGHRTHEVIRGRAENSIEAQQLQLPSLAALPGSDSARACFPIPGMYGGFSDWLVGEGQDAKLVCKCWCRVEEGSGQRHEVTAIGSRLVAKGFV
jgi:hypothetical protein